MTKPELIPIHRQEIQVGAPAPYPLFDAHHTLLLGEGDSILSEQQLESLLEIGLYRAAHWRNTADATGVHPHSEDEHAIQHFAQLKLQPGSALHARRTDIDSGGYVAVKLIGWLVGEDLIVNTTTQDGSPFLPEAGTPLEIKLLAGKGIVTFQTRVSGSSPPPHAYLHLHYPQALGIRQLRKNLRVNIQLPASASNGHANESHEGILINLSACGGMLELPQLFAQVGDELHLTLSLPAIGQEHPLSLRAIVRNLHTDGGNIPKVQYGLEFLDTASSERLVLEHYIFQTLLEN